MPPGTFRARRGLGATVLGIGALNLAFFGTDAFVPFMLTEIRGQSTVFVGAIFTASTLCWTAGTWVVERSKDRVSRATFVAAGLGLVALGTLGHIAVLHSGVPVIFSGLTWSVGAFGIGIAYPSFSLLLLAQAPRGSEGTVTSAAKLAEALAAAVGAGVVGAIVNAGEASGDLSTALALSFALMAAVAALGALLGAAAEAGRVRQPWKRRSSHVAPRQIDRANPRLRPCRAVLLSISLTTLTTTTQIGRATIGRNTMLNRSATAAR